MPRRITKIADGLAAVRACLEQGLINPQLTVAVRFLLEELAEVAPGNSVEVRVPPLSATQCIAGPRHTRGTPPNVVEMSPEVWFDLALGRLSWDEALASARVSASGNRATLVDVLPLKLELN